MVFDGTPYIYPVCSYFLLYSLHVHNMRIKPWKVDRYFFSIQTMHNPIMQMSESNDEWLKRCFYDRFLFKYYGAKKISTDPVAPNSMVSPVFHFSATQI